MAEVLKTPAGHVAPILSTEALVSGKPDPIVPIVPTGGGQRGMRALLDRPATRRFVSAARRAVSDATPPAL